MRKVVCSALRTDEGDLILGPRHFDATMHKQILRLEQARTFKAQRLQPPPHYEQGFIDQWGNFMCREEAKQVAEAAGQIRYRCGGDEFKLFSENLY